jgi:hypothetical protein
MDSRDVMQDTGGVAQGPTHVFSSRLGLEAEATSLVVL